MKNSLLPDTKWGGRHFTGTGTPEAGSSILCRAVAPDAASSIHSPGWRGCALVMDYAFRGPAAQVGEFRYTVSAPR